MKISIHNVAEHGTITAVIEAIAKEHDTIASGIIGPSFATSGPGPGWSRQYDVSDYAKRALADDYGAGSYIDSEDGREATLDEDGEIEWTEESVIELEIPSLDEALEYPEAYQEMAKGAAGPHACNVHESEWKDLARQVAARSPEAVEAAIERIDGNRINDDEVVYYDDNTRSYYKAPVEDLYELAELMMSDDESVASDAYSHWCAGTSHPECDEEGNELESGKK